MSPARVSVVLCTYQGSQHLPAQLASLLAQTLQPYEVVAFDDGSTDGTVALLEQFRAEAPFPVLFQQQPLNVGSTRNFDSAMEAASGDYIALCDQDDVWFPEKLASLSAVLEASPQVGGVFSDAAIVKGDTATDTGQTLWQQHRFTSGKRQAVRTGHAVPLLLRHDIITGATLMVRTSLRHLWHPIPATWVHDGWLAWMLAIHSRIELVEQTLVGYRVHDGQQLGVGHGTRMERIRNVHRTERARYTRVAQQFRDLLRRLEEQQAVDETLRAALTAKADFLDWRVRLPPGFLKRAGQVLGAMARYTKYARGWRSMRKDLMLG